MNNPRNSFLCWLVLCMLLSGCAAPLAPAPSPLSLAGGEVAPDTGQDTHMAPRSWQVPLPTAPPPTSTPLAAPDSTLLLTATSAIINLADQGAALLPDFAADLHAAGAWDHYRIEAVLLPDELTIAGRMDLELSNRGSSPLDALYFHLYPNHPDFGGLLTIGEGVLVDGQPVATALEQEGVLLRLALNQPLAPGAGALVSLNFAARTPQNASGSTYGAFNWEGGVWALASFAPVLARRFGDAWDLRPVSDQGDLAVTETALYDVTIDTPPDWSLVATGARVAQQQLDHGPRRERFVSGPQRDFFLAAFRGLDQASTVVDGTRLVSYYQRDNPAAGRQSLVVAGQALRIFNSRFGRYPLNELELLQVPLTRFWGVEYPGVILIEQGLYRRGGRELDTTVAHEVAHQWWYSLVGNDVQGEPWLDEGLTSYAQVLYYEGQGNLIAAESELQRFRDQYLAARKAGHDGSVGGAAGSFGDNYFALVYAKGALFFHALRLSIGEEAFSRFLQSYYATYRYGEATGGEMLQQAETACGCDLQPLYDDWINESAPVAIP